MAAGPQGTNFTMDQLNNQMFTGDERRVMNDWAIRYVDAEKVQSVLERAKIARILEKAGSVSVPGMGQRVSVMDSRTYMRWQQKERGMLDDKKERDFFLGDNPQYCAKGYKPKIRPKVFDMGAAVTA